MNIENLIEHALAGRRCDVTRDSSGDVVISLSNRRAKFVILERRLYAMQLDNVYNDLYRDLRAYLKLADFEHGLVHNLVAGQCGKVRKLRRASRGSFR